MAVACRRSIPGHDTIKASKRGDVDGDFEWLSSDTNNSRIANFVSRYVEHKLSAWYSFQFESPVIPAQGGRCFSVLIGRRRNNRCVRHRLITAEHDADQSNGGLHSADD